MDAVLYRILYLNNVFRNENDGKDVIHHNRWAYMFGPSDGDPMKKLISDYGNERITAVLISGYGVSVRSIEFEVNGESKGIMGVTHEEYEQKLYLGPSEYIMQVDINHRRQDTIIRAIHSVTFYKLMRANAILYTNNI
eukprot:217637_1